MKVKKFVASTMPEAMNQIRKELGIDAIILHSREIQTGGFLGFFTKKALEVTAAIDQAPTKLNSKSLITENYQEITEQPKNKSITSVTEGRNVDKESYKGLTQQIEELTKSIADLHSNNQVLRDRIPPKINMVGNYFLAQEVLPEIVDEIIGRLLECWYRKENIENEPNQLQLIEEWTKRILEEMLVEHLSTVPELNRKIITLVGPTGVGKTTTLAKLAAAASLNDKKKVAFITTDTYRIAAIEQLKTYSEIISVPIKVAYNADDFKAAITEFNDYEQIFVDTAGRNFLKKFYVDELTNMIDFNEDMQTFLVMSLTAKYSDMEAIYTQFSDTPNKQLIFTKKDETSSYGNILNMIIKEKVGVAFITTGQNVPDDIEPIELNDIIQLITEGLFHE